MADLMARPRPDAEQSDFYTGTLNLLSTDRSDPSTSTKVVDHSLVLS